MNTKGLLLGGLMVCSVLMISCKGGKTTTNTSPIQESKHDRIAKEICDCSNEVVIFLEKVEMKESGEYAFTEKEINRMEPLMDDFLKCIQGLADKYPTYGEDPEEEALAMNALKRRCPPVYQVIMNRREN